MKWHGFARFGPGPSRPLASERCLAVAPLLLVLAGFAVAYYARFGMPLTLASHIAIMCLDCLPLFSSALAGPPMHLDAPRVGQPYARPCTCARSTRPTGWTNPSFPLADYSRMFAMTTANGQKLFETMQISLVCGTRSLQTRPLVRSYHRPALLSDGALAPRRRVPPDRPSRTVCMRSILRLLDRTPSSAHALQLPAGARTNRPRCRGGSRRPNSKSSKHFSRTTPPCCTPLSTPVSLPSHCLYQATLHRLGWYCSNTLASGWILLRDKDRGIRRPILLDCLRWRDRVDSLGTSNAVHLPGRCGRTRSEESCDQ